MESLLAFTGAVFEKTRLRMLQVLLLHKELCVCELAAIFKISPARTSQHLQLLRRTGAVNERRDGKWVYYSVNPQAFAAFNESWQAFLHPRPERDIVLRQLVDALNSKELKLLKERCGAQGRRAKA